MDGKYDPIDLPYLLGRWVGRDTYIHTYIQVGTYLG